MHILELFFQDLYTSAPQERNVVFCLHNLDMTVLILAWQTVRKQRLPNLTLSHTYENISKQLLSLSRHSLVLAELLKLLYHSVQYKRQWCEQLPVRMHQLACIHRLSDVSMQAYHTIQHYCSRQLDTPHGYYI